MPESALREQGAPLCRAGTGQAVKDAGSFRVEFARPRREGREFDVPGARNAAAPHLGCAAHVDELWRGGAVEQGAQSSRIERLEHRVDAQKGKGTA